MRRTHWIAALTAACAAVAGCSSQTNVSMQTSVQAKYTHVWLTVQEIWFNTNAAATPEDTSWNRLPLSTPITIDLATTTAGSLAQIASDLKVPAGTYSQIRLIPVDSTAALTSAAQTAGALYNAEADYTDSDATAHQALLELLNPDKGIGISTTLTIKTSLGALGTPTSTTTTNTDSTTQCAIGDPSCEQDTTTPVTTSAVATTSSTTTPLSLALTLDGVHDLVQFGYDGQIGVLLNPHSSAYDVSTTGTVRGTIDLTNISGSVESSGAVDVQVTAESLSADGSRHIAVKTAQVASDGTFVLYPLPASSSSSSTTTYDLVIHGPQIATVIVKSVPVAVGDPSSTAAVSIGNVVPHSATPFTFNLAIGSQALPAGALVNLYQTLPGSGEVPYLVDQVAIDPFARSLPADEALPTGTIDSGAYVSGGNVTLTTSTPAQGDSAYLVSAQAPLFSDGTLITVVGPPTSGSGPVPVSLPTLVPAGGAGSGSMGITVTPALAGRYDRGELIISHDGAIVQTVAIDTALTQNGGATLQVQGIPAGGSASSFDNAVYYVSTRAWNSSDPAGTLQRQSFTVPVDLSAGSVTGLSVNVD
jgi:Domain of unknown function (DUF4382)